MTRLVASLIFGALLAGCSGSNRVEGIVPTWANAQPPRGEAPQHRARESRVEAPTTPRTEPSTPRTEPQAANKPQIGPLEE